MYLNVVQTKLSTNDWFTSEYNDSKSFDRVLNLGTPHGLTGIILLLLIVKEKGFDIDEEILNSMFEIIISFRFKENKKIECYFPSKVFKDGRCNKSGLAWCYGDLMIAYAMLKYGILYKNDYYIRYSKIILNDSFSKKMIHSENLILCHGYSSLSLIYNMIYKKTDHYNIY